MSQLNDYPDVLNVSDIQKILGIGRNKAYELVSSDSFHTVCIGTLIKIPKASFIAWLESKNNHN